jgi:hypothetical protein
MAKKSKTRLQPARQQTNAPPVAARRGSWYQDKKMLLGGVILGLVIGLGVFIRSYQHSQLAPRLQGAIDNHYTRGVSGAPVVIKEFSDYG